MLIWAESTIRGCKIVYGPLGTPPSFCGAGRRYMHSRGLFKQGGTADSSVPAVSPFLFQFFGGKYENST